MVPPQQLIVTCEQPADVADFWAAMTKVEPDLFNAWFVLAPGNGRDD